MPVFSIVLPCLNAEATIGQTLKSLTAQTCPDWEAICVDDGSTDGTVAIILAAASADRRIRFASNSGKGLGAARNHGGCDLARGDIIAFCGAQDQWHPQRLAQLATAFADRDVLVAYGRIEPFREVPDDPTAFSRVPRGALTIPVGSSVKPVGTGSNIAVRREAFRRSGGFDPAKSHNEDLDWLIRLIDRHPEGRVINLPTMSVSQGSAFEEISADLDALEAGHELSDGGLSLVRRRHAVYLRSLSRIEMRRCERSFAPLRLALSGISQSPIGFFSPPMSGIATLATALMAPLLPRAWCRRLFSR